MTPGVVRLTLAHVRCLIGEQREVRDILRGVCSELRELGSPRLADELQSAITVLGRMGLVLRASESAAERGATVDGELRRLTQTRRGDREVA